VLSDAGERFVYGKDGDRPLKIKLYSDYAGRHAAARFFIQVD